MKVTIRLDPNTPSDKQKAFEKIKHKVTILHVNRGTGRHDYEIAFLPNDMVNLEYLFCANNQLTSLPCGMNSLCYLFCKNNQLTSLPNDIVNLKRLSCENNQLASLPSVMSFLEVLSCKNNYLRFLPDDMTSLEYLSSDFTELREGNQEQAYHRLRREDNLPFRSSMKRAR